MALVGMLPQQLEELYLSGKGGRRLVLRQIDAHAPDLCACPACPVGVGAGNAIGDEGAVALADMLGRLSRLQTLALSCTFALRCASQAHLTGLLRDLAALHRQYDWSRGRGSTLPRA